jgi:hypothetical protein
MLNGEDLRKKPVAGFRLIKTPDRISERAVSLFLLFWPLADIGYCTAHVRFRGKADMQQRKMLMRRRANLRTWQSRSLGI